MTRIGDIWAALDAAIESVETPSEGTAEPSTELSLGHPDQILDHSDGFWSHGENAWSKDFLSIPAGLEPLEPLDHKNKQFACARDPEEDEGSPSAETSFSPAKSVLDGPKAPNGSKPAETLGKSLDHAGFGWLQHGPKWSGEVSVGGNIYSLDAARTFRQAFLAADLPSPDGDDLNAWRRWMHSRVQVWVNRGRSKSIAIQIVWGEAVNEHHRRHGATPNPDRCAGCGSWLMDEPGMSLPDGARVHVNLDCMAMYGNEWRRAAADGLVALGINPPSESTPGE
jgi:hypothetical protein